MNSATPQPQFLRPVCSRRRPGLLQGGAWSVLNARDLTAADRQAYGFPLKVGLAAPARGLSLGMALIGKARGTNDTCGTRAGAPKTLGDRVRQKRCIHIGTECFIDGRRVETSRPTKTRRGNPPACRAAHDRLQSRAVAGPDACSSTSVIVHDILRTPAPTER
ncbi:MAG: hypothetical protein KF788_08220 [Piscinibacter sp.]|nr:hypothetical protein [Piscinibacter sp.]